MIAGVFPHLVAALGVACAVGACNSGSDAQVRPPVVLGMTDKMAPFYQDQATTLYEAQIPIPLPVRQPDSGEVQGAAVDPYGAHPFILDGDERIEVRFTLSNVDDTEHTVELLIDPWNEFVRYRAGVTVVNDEQTTPNFSGIDKFFVIPAKGRITGTITPDDMSDLAIKLATAEVILAKPPDPMAPTNQTQLVNRNFNIQHRANDGDPLLTPLIPQVIAGLTGFDLGVRTYAPANVAVEITIDVTDLNGHRIVPAGSTLQTIGVPGRVLSPAAAR